MVHASCSCFISPNRDHTKGHFWTLQWTSDLVSCKYKVPLPRMPKCSQLLTFFYMPSTLYTSMQSSLDQLSKISTTPCTCIEALSYSNQKEDHVDLERAMSNMSWVQESIGHGTKAHVVNTWSYCDKVTDITRQNMLGRTGLAVCFNNGMLYIEAKSQHPCQWYAKPLTSWQHCNTSITRLFQK